LILEFIKFLKEKSNKKKVIVIGEIHGTKEIPELLTAFFSTHARDNEFDICLELSSCEQTNMDRFLSSGDEQPLMSMFLQKSEHDGRRTREYLELIRTIRLLNLTYDKHIKIRCIDVDDEFVSADVQNDRERIMATNILNRIEKKTFVIIGNIHASKKDIYFAENKIVPTGKYIYEQLKDEMIAINLIPKQGSFYNFSIKTIAPHASIPLEDNVDFTYYIDMVSAATTVLK